MNELKLLSNKLSSGGNVYSIAGVKVTARNLAVWLTQEPRTDWLLLAKTASLGGQLGVPQHACMWPWRCVHPQAWCTGSKPWAMGAYRAPATHDRVEDLPNWSTRPAWGPHWVQKGQVLWHISSYIRQKWFSMFRNSPFMNRLLPLKCFNIYKKSQWKVWEKLLVL